MTTEESSKADIWKEIRILPSYLFKDHPGSGYPTIKTDEVLFRLRKKQDDLEEKADKWDEGQQLTSREEYEQILTSKNLLINKHYNKRLEAENKIEALITWIKKTPQYGEGGLEEIEAILKGGSDSMRERIKFTQSAISLYREGDNWRNPADHDKFPLTYGFYGLLDYVKTGDSDKIMEYNLKNFIKKIEAM